MSSAEVSDDEQDLQGYVINLKPPQFGSAARRRQWDRSYKNGSICSYKSGFMDNETPDEAFKQTSDVQSNDDPPARGKLNHRFEDSQVYTMSIVYMLSQAAFRGCPLYVMTEKKLQAVTERPIRMPEGHSDSQRVLSSDDDPETEIFQDLIMDTGSNISWLFSEDFRIMWLKDDHASTIPPTLPTPVYRLFFRDDVTGEYDHQGYYTSPAGVYSNPPAKPILTYYVDDPTRPGWREGSDSKLITIDSKAPARVVQYDRGASAFVTLAPELADIRINGSFLWDSNGLFWGSPQTEFRFGVCFGATRGLIHECIHGSIGLGTSNVQDLPPSRTAVGAPSAPSLMSAFDQSKELLPPETGKTGFVLYFVLRPPPGYRGLNIPTAIPDSQLEDWFSINRWPCSQKVEWSPKIPVPAESLGSRSNTWSMRLKGLTLMKQAIGSDGGAQTYNVVSKCPVPDGGVEVILDTGSSVSYVSEELIRHLHRNVFPDGQTKPLPTGPWNLENEPLYTVVIENYPIALWYVALEIQGFDMTTVRVNLPCAPFLAMATVPHEDEPSSPRRHVWDGLLYPQVVQTEPTESESTTRSSNPTSPTDHPGEQRLEAPFWVFGIPFFHSVFVALHKPEADYDQPYIRLSPRWGPPHDAVQLPRTRLRSL